jgi:hypothetical protein
MLARLRERFLGLVRRVALPVAADGERGGFSVAEGLMMAMVGVILIAAVGVLIRTGAAQVVTNLLNRILQGI